MSIEDKYNLFKQYQENSVLNKKLLQIGISDFIIQIDKLNEKDAGSFNLKSNLKSLTQCINTFFLFIFQKKKTFLFFPLDETHLKQMLSVATAIKKTDEHSILFVSTKSRLRKEIVENGFKFIELPVFTLSNFFSNNKEKRIYNRANYFNQLSKVIHSFILPKAVILGNDLILENRALTITSTEKNVQTFCIQHGSMNSLNPLYREILVGNYFVYGQRTKNHLETLNLSNTKFLVSGAPYLENLEFNKNLSKMFYQKVLILLSGPGHSYTLNHHKEILTSLIRLSELNTEINFVLKPHPKDGFSKNIVENSRIKFLSNEELKAANKNTLELITEFDLIISGASTSVIEAIALGKKVITIDYEKAYSEADFIQDGLTNHCTSENQLQNYFENLQSNLNSTKENANDINEYFQQNKVGLKPSEIIAKEILSCVE